MSSYHTTVMDRQTGEIKSVVCIDNYFNQHEYGFFVLEGDKAGSPLNLTELEERYEFV